MPIRNDVAHGFTVRMDEVHAALVLRAASVLITASGSVEGETKTLPLAELPSVPRPGCADWPIAHSLSRPEVCCAGTCSSNPTARAASPSTAAVQSL
jgi:hypothetical protein